MSDETKNETEIWTKGEKRRAVETPTDRVQAQWDGFTAPDTDKSEGDEPSVKDKAPEGGPGTELPKPTAGGTGGGATSSGPAVPASTPSATSVTR